MSRKKNGLSLFVVVLTLTSWLTICEIASAQEYLSPAAVVADAQGKTLYIGEATAKQIAVYDIETAKVTATIAVGAEPTGLALTDDGTLLYVTCAAPDGSICVIDTDTAKVKRQFPAGYGARSPVLSPDGKTLYVCNRFDNDVSLISTEQIKQTTSIPTLREPVAADITPDGRWLFVGNHLPHGSANSDSIACNVSVINARKSTFEIDIALPNGSTGLQDITVSPDGRLVFVSHILARYTIPTTQLERGWINTNAVSIIDTWYRTLLETVLLDDVDHGAANPWAVACTSDGKLLCITHAGTHELSVIETRPLIDKISAHRRRDRARSEDLTGIYSGNSYGSGSGSNIPNELSFLYGLRERIKLPGRGPRSLAIIGRKAYVAEYFSDSMALVDITEDSRHKTSSVALGPKLPMTAERRGEMLFNDALSCFQGWQSCTSCHPSDARVDALNWDLLNDGLGNPNLKHPPTELESTEWRDHRVFVPWATIHNWVEATGEKSEATIKTEYVDGVLLDFSGYIAADELYDGPFCVLFIVDNHKFKRLCYEVLDHNPTNRDRYATIPKCLINSSGDQFFLPDSTQFYFHDLPGEKHVRYVPNTDHSLGGSDAVESLLVFFKSVVTGAPRPKFTWSVKDDCSIEVETTTKPTAVKLWQASNPETRDFRLEERQSIKSHVIVEIFTKLPRKRRSLTVQGNFDKIIDIERTELCFVSV